MVFATVQDLAAMPAGPPEGITTFLVEVARATPKGYVSILWWA